MKFSIRDDDTNYFTDPGILEQNYKEVWDKCPVSLSVVPFHASTKSGGIPPEYWRGEEVFPLGENKDLVVFLKEKIGEKRISIMLHGYSHKDHKNIYEFDAKESLVQKVKEGKEYLEQILGVEIKTFVPPHNSISKEGLKAIVKNNLNVVVTPSFKFNKRPVSIRNIGPFFNKVFYFLKHGNKYPYVVDFSDHKELNYFSLTPRVSIDWLKAGFDYCYKMNGVFCLATHYWEFKARQVYDNNIEMGEIFKEFWGYVNGYTGIDFTTVDELFCG